MTLSELKNNISDKNKEYIETSKRANQLMLELNYLRRELENLKRMEFLNYIEIGEEIVLKHIFSHNGIQIKGGVDVTINNIHILFKEDSFKIVKKNKKSIIIEVTKCDRLKNKLIQINKQPIENPGWLFRVNLDVFYGFYLRNETRRNAFETYIKRKEALQQLLG